ncbi:MAG: hypothetical protein ABSG08_01095 [Terriglobales bacterium]|jgi:hypothetical protein
MLWSIIMPYASNPALTRAIEQQRKDQQFLFADPLLDQRTVRAALGNCSYHFLRKLILSGRLPAWRPNPSGKGARRGQHRIRQSALKAFLAQGDHHE